MEKQETKERDTWQELKDTLIAHPEIEEVHFLQNGSHSFNCYVDEHGKKHARNGIELMNEKTRKKFLLFDDKHVISKTMSREEILTSEPEKTNTAKSTAKNSKTE